MALSVRSLSHYIYIIFQVPRHIESLSHGIYIYIYITVPGTLSRLSLSHGTRYSQSLSYGTRHSQSSLFLTGRLSESLFLSRHSQSSLFLTVPGTLSRVSFSRYQALSVENSFLRYHALSVESLSRYRHSQSSLFLTVPTLSERMLPDTLSRVSFSRYQALSVESLSHGTRHSHVSFSRHSQSSLFLTVPGTLSRVSFSQYQALSVSLFLTYQQSSLFSRYQALSVESLSHGGRQRVEKLVPYLVDTENLPRGSAAAKAGGCEGFCCFALYAKSKLPARWPTSDIESTL